MSVEASEPGPSLIQQRFALRRRRAYALWMLGVSSFLAAGWIATLMLDGSAVWRWVGLTVILINALMGGIELRRALTAIRAFEERHGRAAGVQR